jgi:ComF family protein
MFTILTDSVLSVIFPNKCTACGLGVESHADGTACADCWAATRIFDGSEGLCEKCGVLLSEGRVGVYQLCGDCATHHYDRAFAIGIYEKALAVAVVSLKKDPHISARLRDAIVCAFSMRPAFPFTSIIPIPLSKKRIHERGHNQAAAIANVVGESLGCPVDEYSVERTTHTPMHRGLMDRKARETSVKKSFNVVRPKLIARQNILLVDDVFTTGSTVSSCAAALKKAGAGNVTVFTLARAVKRF